MLNYRIGVSFTQIEKMSVRKTRFFLLLLTALLSAFQVCMTKYKKIRGCSPGALVSEEEFDTMGVPTDKQRLVRQI